MARGESKLFTQKIAKCTSKMLTKLSNKELRTLKRRASREVDEALAMWDNRYGAFSCVMQEYRRRDLDK